MVFDIWTNRSLMKKLFDQKMQIVYQTSGLTRMEVEILLFLYHHPEFDCAKDIVEQRQLTKSHVSTSLQVLEDKGFITKYYKNDNRKIIHMKLCVEADEVINLAIHALDAFFAVLLRDFSEEEQKALDASLDKITKNLKQAFREEE